MKVMSIPMTVGQRVRQRRNELGLKQEELALKAGISKSFLSDLENGKRSIGAETLLDLGRAMGVSLDYLMTGESSDQEGKQPQIPTSLAMFAAKEGLSVRDALTLLHMHDQVAFGRKRVGKRQAKINWQEFYNAVKRFL